MTDPEVLGAPPALASLLGAPEPARIGNVLIGTASWTEKTLLDSGAFYPSVVRNAEDRLRYYARHFPLVEVDSTYYALPSVRNTLHWAERTPADFVFGVKAFGPMTGHPVDLHRLDRDLVEALPSDLRDKGSAHATSLPREIRNEIWHRFSFALAPLRAARKLGYVLIQLPPWFQPSREAFAYLEHLPERLPETRLAVEFRAARWMDDANAADTLERLRAKHLAYVCVDEPQGTDRSVPPVAEVTCDDLAVVRFHGRRLDDWTRRGASTTERFGYCYREDELREWTGRIHALARRAKSVYVLMNNCYQHYAVQGAKDLARLLQEAPEASSV